MQAVVTGGAGFIGANVCRRLIEGGVESVTVLDDLSTGNADNLRGLPVRLVVGSILDEALLGLTCAAAQAIVHLAARPSVPRSLLDPVATHEVNATGTVRVLEVARQHGCQVVVASSSSVYGDNPSLPKHEGLATSPLSPYGASKLAAEAYALAYQRSFGLDVLAFRFFNVFGPLQSAGHSYAAVVPAFVSAAIRRTPLTVYGDGHQTRDFTYVRSVSDVIVRAITDRVTSTSPVNLAFGTRCSLLEVIYMLQAILGYELEVRYCDQRAGDVRNSQADGASLSGLFPDAVPVPLELGLRETIAWFRDAGSDDRLVCSGGAAW